MTNTVNTAIRLLCLCLMLGMSPGALAAGAAEEPVQEEQLIRSPLALENFWEDLMKAVVNYYRTTIRSIETVMKSDQGLRQIVAEARNTDTTVLEESAQIPVVQTEVNSTLLNFGTISYTPNLNQQVEPEEPVSSPTPVNEPEPEVMVPEPEPVLGSARLSWSIPTKRENGDALNLTEIDSYEIYVTAEEAGSNRTIRVENRDQTQYTLNSLQPDTYYFSMVTIDTDGMYSELSQVVSKTIQ